MARKPRPHTREEMRRAWLAEFFICGYNGAEAARRVGYKYPDQISKKLRGVFKEDIQAHLDEKMMRADEALSLMADQASANITDFTESDGHGGYFIDLDKARAAGKMHLIKKLWTDAKGFVRVELYDKQRALELVLKAHGAFTENVNLRASGEVTFKVQYDRDES